MAATLDEKIAATESFLLDVLQTVDPGLCRVAWTGGKDSTVVLYIWKAVLDHHGIGPVRGINLDTGCKFPEILAFRDRITAEWGVDLHVARPDVPLDGYPLAEDKVACCRDLKILPLNAAIASLGVTHLLTGIRRDEHPDRASRERVERRDDPAYSMINPILEWTETDIWAFHDRFDVPHCELYDRGYRSLGCKPCTTKQYSAGGERSGRSAEKEQAMKTLTSLGYF